MTFPMCARSKPRQEAMQGHTAIEFTSYQCTRKKGPTKVHGKGAADPNPLSLSIPFLGRDGYN